MEFLGIEKILCSRYDINSARKRELAQLIYLDTLAQPSIS